jgi:hypothetical protein
VKESHSVFGQAGHSEFRCGLSIGTFLPPDQSEVLIRETESAIDEGRFDIATHARQRALRVGSVSLIKNVLVPLVILVTTRPRGNHPGGPESTDPLPASKSVGRGLRARTVT